MTEDALNKLLARLPQTCVAVVGDYCLDVYWTMDMSASEPSVETGLATHPVRAQNYELGGAGNVVNNLVAAGVGRVAAFGVLGDDPFGREMLGIMTARGVDLGGMVEPGEAWDTPAYIKRIWDDREDHRIDFSNFNDLADDVADEALQRLEAALPEIDLVVVNQQLRKGLHSAHFQAGLDALMAAHPDTPFIVDSRDLADRYTHGLHKLNDYEAARLCDMGGTPQDRFSLAQVAAAGRQLYSRWEQPVFVTRGERGCLVVDAEGEHTIRGLHIVGRTDTVGAGDAMLAGLAAALAAGQPPAAAAAFGNYVAGVTVQKLLQTGTANPDEIRAIARGGDFTYNPDLADDPAAASFLDGAAIEVVEAWPAGARVTHAIFDHDGTISTLREGWEQVMEPMMIDAVLGARGADLDPETRKRIVDRVHEFIDKTTGIQTLVQMQGLVAMVREVGLVDEGDILDEFGYKEIYNDALMARIDGRLNELRDGKLAVEDFTLAQAPRFLQRLYDAGVKLFLASGTDEGDVINEAETLGYAGLFEGRIYGAVGDVTKEAKREALDRILRDVGAENAASLVTFGDGPVELRETRKRGGLVVGVASDEVRRCGMNPAKRGRLIRAGAMMIIPDFSEQDVLFPLLGVGPGGD